MPSPKRAEVEQSRFLGRASQREMNQAIALDRRIDELTEDKKERQLHYVHTRQDKKRQDKARGANTTACNTTQYNTEYAGRLTTVPKHTTVLQWYLH